MILPVKTTASDSQLPKQILEICRTMGVQSHLGELMPEIQFEPSKTTLRDMLRNDNYYVIPRFQRPFSWDGDNFADFWRDLTKDESTGYFIGPMVIWQERDSHIARVVDGQQRLTTIMMMLCAIRDKFAEFDENDLASALHQLIQKQNDDG